MIKESIKLYDEPVPMYLQSTSHSCTTQEEVLTAINEAKMVVRIGDRFRYKHNPTNVMKIIGFEENPAKVCFYKGEVAPIIMQNERSKAENKYSLGELFDSYMEPMDGEEIVTSC
jgi:hypothetical protein